MASAENRSTDVGRFIRQQVIPAGMSVTEAARRLNVGRPALSNLVNGRAALSQNMALRLEATFGADRVRLLELQAATDRDRRSVEDRAVAVGTYAPSFLTIKARQIDEWASGNIRARDHLPVLLRRLIHATGRELRHVDFPGYDNAQRHGWDGQVEAHAATLWVPEGRSFWEFGVDRRPKTKADRDYRARLRALSPEERAKCTFVFVTPRNWPGMDEWVQGKEAAGDWKTVRALDASDLEQWLEDTIAPRVWLADELGIPTEGFETLDRFWDRWAEASHPPMTPKIFEPSVAAHLDRFRKWLEKTPGDGPLTVAADSREEAVAFIACLFRHSDAPLPARDHAVVFESAGTLRTLSGSPSPFIPIVYGEDTEREIVSHYRQRHCVVVRPRNAVDREPDVAVELLGHEAFDKALADMGITERERVDRLASESGRSPTVLRRRTSLVDGIRVPAWAGEKDVARHLIPIALVGAWCKASRTDCEVLAALAGRPYRDVEEGVAELLRYDDCPVWSVGQYHGVVSRIDALFGIGSWITENDIARFLPIAQYVLSESDRAPELPEPPVPDPGWPLTQHAPGAKFFGQPRRYSDALRTGVCETLILLSVHGNALFRDSRGIVDVAEWVAAIVNRLLTPFTGDALRQHGDNLPGFAEAAPNAFLALLEEDLTQPQPTLLEILKPARAGMFGNNPARCGVLWALECLAWNPQNLMRVVNILARLSQIQLDDNLLDKPINSLFAIFCSGVPQTAAPLHERMTALEALCRRFPDIGWRTCIQQFDGLQHIVLSPRPRWRNDAAGAGQPGVHNERREFVRKALDLAIAWPTHDKTILGDLVELLGSMSDQDRSSTWNRIDAWARTETDEKAKAELRERIRRAAFTRRGRLRSLDADQRDRAHATCEKLASRDPVLRHAWVFAGARAYDLTDLADDGEGDRRDLSRQAERIRELRTKAMAEIWSAQGLDGALALLPDSDAWWVGHHAASCAADGDATDVLRTCLSADPDSDGRLDDFVRGFLGFFGDDTRAALISAVSATAIVEQRVRLFRCAPFGDPTWRLLDRQDPCVRERYWRTVQPRMAQFSESETTEILDGLLEAERPKDAFEAVECDWGKVETARVKRLLMAIEAEFAVIGIDRYRVSEALESLDGRVGVTVDEMARLELAFIEALDPLNHARHGIPNLERKIAESPVFFVQAVVLPCKRGDGGQDRPEWRAGGADGRSSWRHDAYRLLEQLTRIPGTDARGWIDSRSLMQWVVEARRLCRESGRAEVGDQRIGQLLSRAPAEDGGRRWPCEPVCEALETIASKDVAYGFRRGVEIGRRRGDGMRLLDGAGAQERELSAKYRAWENQWRFRYPYVASILKRLAEDHGRAATSWDSRVLEGKRLEH